MNISAVISYMHPDHKKTSNFSRNIFFISREKKQIELISIFSIICSKNTTVFVAEMGKK